MPPKSSEYGATPDTEKGESDEDRPRLMCWCFNTTRRMLRTILLVVPFLVMVTVDLGASYDVCSRVGAFSDGDAVADSLGRCFLIVLLCNTIGLVVYLVWIPLVSCILGWDEPFPRYFPNGDQLVYALFVHVSVLCLLALFVTFHFLRSPGSIL